MSEKKELNNPCKEFGPVQRLALVWFLGAVIVGVGLVYKFAQTDRWMYDHNAQVLDFNAYRENRQAQAGIASEQIDPRRRADLTAVEQKLSAPPLSEH